MRSTTQGNAYDMGGGEDEGLYAARGHVLHARDVDRGALSLPHERTRCGVREGQSCVT